MQHSILCSLAIISIAAFFYDVQAAPTAVALRSPTGVIDTTGDSNTRVKRQGGGCGCCGGCGCGCGCCCCRPKCCCCCQRCCTCCRTCCCTRCCTCCRPCCCGCGCGCCGCGGGRKRRALQTLAIKLAEKKSAEAVPDTEVAPEVAPVATLAPAISSHEDSHEEVAPKIEKREVVQTPVGQIVDVPEWPNAYGYY